MSEAREREWREKARNDLAERVMAATGYAEPGVGRMLSDDQIVERITRIAALAAERDQYRKALDGIGYFASGKLVQSRSALSGRPPQQSEEQDG